MLFRSSYLNTGLRTPLTFFRNNDKKEIGLLLEKDGRLHPVEVKKTASPSRKDIRTPTTMGSIPRSYNTSRGWTGYWSPPATNTPPAGHCQGRAGWC